MNRQQIISGLILVAVGIGIYSLPYWFPFLIRQSLSEDFYQASTVIGGAIAAFGLFLWLVSLVKNPDSPDNPDIED